MTKKHPITVAYGDGIGPEIMETTLRILQEAGALLDVETVEIGEKLYLSGHKSGIKDEAWNSIRRTKVFLKAPLTTPQGGGFRSLNVTIRTKLGLYANIRPCVSYNPFISTKHPQMDVVIVRENEEDLYCGIEYRLTPDVTEALKLITRPGCERIIRYAFEYAKSYGRKKVTCFSKDNILKITDGLFHKVFEEIAPEYPDIENEHWIIDIGAAKLADTPEMFDVIVMPNLYGDILSDIGGQISGSVGLSGSANIGAHAAMFEAVHGSAPKRAGQNVANPSGLLFGAIMMLVHINQTQVASSIHNAWLTTIEEGVHTKDIYKEGVSKKCVGTKEFGDEIIKRLGKTPHTLKTVSYETKTKREIVPHSGSKPVSTKRELVGVDIFLCSYDALEKLVHKINELLTPSLKLVKITNRGVEVWPESLPETLCVEMWRARFMGNNANISGQAIAALLHRLADGHLDVVKTENLYTYDGQNGFSD
jgi:isocitrate dehydrogenase